MLISTAFKVNKGQVSADVKIKCPMCDRNSHVVFNGNKAIDAVRDYLSSGTMLTQDLPFETPIREFLRSGYCRECMEMFGQTSSKIKYVRVKERSFA